MVRYGCLFSRKHNFVVPCQCSQTTHLNRSARRFASYVAALCDVIVMSSYLLPRGAAQRAAAGSGRTAGGNRPRVQRTGGVAWPTLHSGRCRACPLQHLVLEPVLRNNSLRTPPALPRSSPICGSSRFRPAHDLAGAEPDPLANAARFGPTIERLRQEGLEEIHGWRGAQRLRPCFAPAPKIV